MMRIAKLFGVLVSALVLAACDAKTPVRPDFDVALQRHLQAIADKDFDAYKATLTTDGDLHLIFPAGEVIDTTAGVEDFHEDWFGDPDWVMEPEIVKTIEGADMATALLKYDYRDRPEGAPRTSWLVLVFKLEEGEWRLVHDQNTRIASEESEAE